MCRDKAKRAQLTAQLEQAQAKIQHAFTLAREGLAEYKLLQAEWDSLQALEQGLNPSPAGGSVATEATGSPPQQGEGEFMPALFLMLRMRDACKACGMHRACSSLMLQANQDLPAVHNQLLLQPRAAALILQGPPQPQAAALALQGLCQLGEARPRSWLVHGVALPHAAEGGVSTGQYRAVQRGGTGAM